MIFFCPSDIYLNFKIKLEHSSRELSKKRREMSFLVIKRRQVLRGRMERLLFITVIYNDGTRHRQLIGKPLAPTRNLCNWRAVDRVREVFRPLFRRCPFSFFKRTDREAGLCGELFKFSSFFFPLNKIQFWLGFDL